MEMFLHEMLRWISSATGLPEISVLPQVRFLKPYDLVAMRYGEAARANSEIHAVYDDATGTIFLRSDWDGASFVDISVMVHELVHHVQNVASLKYGCEAEREAMAYKAQELWLCMFGENLMTTFGIDSFTLMLTTTCLPH